MSPALAAAIDAAADLAWRPTANMPGSVGYHERKESAERLCERLAAVGRLSANASPQLAFLVEAMRRVAGCSFANRRGESYYARKRAIYELRGCLVVWRESVAQDAKTPGLPIGTATRGSRGLDSDGKPGPAVSQGPIRAVAPNIFAGSAT